MYIVVLKYYIEYLILQFHAEYFVSCIFKQLLIHGLLCFTTFYHLKFKLLDLCITLFFQNGNDI